MKKVLCIGDSLGLPRPQVPYTDTWISLLRQQRENYNFIADFHRNATTNILSQWEYGEHLLFYEPEIIILQLGICDCAPRYFPTYSFIYRLLNKLPAPWSSLIWKIIKLIYKRSIKRSDVSPSRFYDNLTHYIQKCVSIGVKQIIIIQIASPTEIMQKANPLIKNAVDAYNEILKKLAHTYPIIQLIHPLDKPLIKYYTIDGYHPNKEGNELVAQAINNVII